MEPQTPAPTPETQTTPAAPSTTEVETPSLISAPVEGEAPKTEGEKPAESEAPKAEEPFVFPEAELKIPEGFTVDEAAKKDFIALATEHKLPPATANALVELQAKLAKQGQDAQLASWQNMQTAWRNEVQSHPEIGGEKLAGVLTDVAKVVDKYGSAELREVMTLTGAGNNVHVIRFLNAIAKDVVESTPVSGSPVSTPKSLAENLYNTMSNKG